MIDIKEQQHVALLNQAKHLLNKNNQTQLVSITKKVKQADLLRSFEAAKELGGNRTLWISADRDFAMVSVGIAHEICAQHDWFETVKDAWDGLIEHALVSNPHDVPGTGLVAVGGMAFDPLKTSTALWESYKNSQFIIPSLLLVQSENELYLTTNVTIEQETNINKLVSEMQEMEATFIAGKDIPYVQSTVTDKQEIDANQWKQLVQSAKDTIADKHAHKIVLARELRLTFSSKAEISRMLKQLEEMQPNSYIFAMEHGEDCFVGATPERLVRVKQQELLSTCLAGTAPRGKTPEEDEQISKALLQDDKNLQEHDFVVRMIQDAIAPYCSHIEVPEKPVAYPLKNLQHLYTPVTARLKEGMGILDAVKRLHPTPALGGTPNEAALSFIRDHEQLDRGWYGAPVGWMDSNQNGEFAVAIRSGLIQSKEASLFAGCGIVQDSDIEAEYAETAMKFLPMLSALEG